MPVVPEKQGKPNPMKSTEFWLVVALLVALLITEGLVFGLIDKSDRSDVLALTLGTFGAWIGAGAAYFFGRENLRTATDSMLRMRGRSSVEILTDTKLQDMKPKTIPKTFKTKDEVGTVLTWLEEVKERFFAVVLDDKDAFSYAIDEEAFYRFINAQMKEGEKSKDDYATACKKSIQEVIEKFTSDEDLNLLIKSAIIMREDATAFSASEKMEEKRVFVTIVVDEQNKPVGYITTGDIRRIISAQG